MEAGEDVVCVVGVSVSSPRCGEEPHDVTLRVDVLGAFKPGARSKVADLESECWEARIPEHCDWVLSSRKRRGEVLELVDDVVGEVGSALDLRIRESKAQIVC